MIYDLEMINSCVSVSKAQILTWLLEAPSPLSRISDALSQLSFSPLTLDLFTLSVSWLVYKKLTDK